MKKTYFIALVLSLFAFIACEKDEDKATISANPEASELVGPAAPNGMAFVKDDADNSIEYSWTAADFGFQASITYGVQLALTDNFENAATILTSGGLTGTAVIRDINSVLLAFDLEIGVEATVKCRVFATLGAGTDSVFSSVTDYTVIPYETLIDYPMIYVPGAYQGWAPGDENGRLFSYGFNSVYEGIIRLDGGDPVAFKIAPAPNWDNSWGGVLIASGDNYTGILDPNPPDNYFAAAGTYKFKVDVTALTISLIKTDDWGIIGSAIPPYDWSGDVNMFYNGQRKMWEVTGDFKAGEFKFRANDDWGVNFGDSEPDGNLDTNNDNNIVIATDGNYTIRADFENLIYQVIKN